MYLHWVPIQIPGCPESSQSPALGSDPKLYRCFSHPSAHPQVSLEEAELKMYLIKRQLLMDGRQSLDKESFLQVIARGAILSHAESEWHSSQIIRPGVQRTRGCDLQSHLDLGGAKMGD